MSTDATATDTVRPPATENRKADVVRIVLVLVAAFWFGVLTEWLQGVLRDPLAMIANSVAWWVVLAFIAGALVGGSSRGPVRGQVRAAMTGVGVEVLLVLGYYAARTLDDVPSDPRIFAVWLGGAVVGGAVFGLMGAWWRGNVAWQQVIGLAVLTGAFVAEGSIRWVMFPWQGVSGAIMCAVGVVAAVALARAPRQRWVVPLLLVVVVPLGLLGEQVLNLILR